MRLDGLGYRLAGDGTFERFGSQGNMPNNRYIAGTGLDGAAPPLPQ